MAPLKTDGVKRNATILATLNVLAALNFSRGFYALLELSGHAKTIAKQKDTILFGSHQ
jgi:hypothetical protein